MEILRNLGFLLALSVATTGCSYRPTDAYYRLMTELKSQPIAKGTEITMRAICTSSKEEARSYYQANSGRRGFIGLNTQSGDAYIYAIVRTHEYPKIGIEVNDKQQQGIWAEAHVATSDWSYNYVEIERIAGTITC